MSRGLAVSRSRGLAVSRSRGLAVSRSRGLAAQLSKGTCGQWAPVAGVIDKAGPGCANRAGDEPELEVDALAAPTPGPRSPRGRAGRLDVAGGLRLDGDAPELGAEEAEQRVGVLHRGEGGRAGGRAAGRGLRDLRGRRARLDLREQAGDPEPGGRGGDVHDAAARRQRQHHRVGLGGLAGRRRDAVHRPGRQDAEGRRVFRSTATRRSARWSPSPRPRARRSAASRACAPTRPRTRRPTCTAR
jgi:hypothetical protein